MRVERGSSVVECRTHNQVSPGSNPPLRASQVLRNAIFLEIGPPPPPRNANNIEHYTFVTLFSRKSDTPHPHLRYLTLEWPLASVSKIGHFRSLHCGPSWLSCINEYVAIDSGGHVSELVLARNCCLARMLPGEAELVSEWTGLPGRAKSVKRFERSDGLDTALYKNYLYLFFTPS